MTRADQGSRLQRGSDITGPTRSPIRPRLPSLAPPATLRGLGPPFARRRLSFEDPRAAGGSKRMRRPTHPSWPLRRSSAEQPDLSTTVTVAGAAASSRPFPAVTTTSSMLSAQRSPFRRTPFPESTPGDRDAFSFGTDVPPPVLVPSSWGSTTSTVSSSRKVRVYCNTLPTLGFARFRLLRGCLRTPLYPSKLSLRSQPPAVTPALARLIHRRDLPSRPFSIPHPPTPCPFRGKRCEAA